MNGSRLEISANMPARGLLQGAQGSACGPADELEDGCGLGGLGFSGFRFGLGDHVRLLYLAPRGAGASTAQTPAGHRTGPGGRWLEAFQDPIRPSPRGISTALLAAEVQ